MKENHRNQTSEDHEKHQAALISQKPKNKEAKNQFKDYSIKS
jgi:hypothetical protein